MADLNHDGKPDIVVSDIFVNVVSVLLNNGDGAFQAPRQFAVGAFSEPVVIAGVFTFGRAVAVADVNRAGNPDILVANYAPSDISVLVGRGDGTFEPQRRFDATVSPFAMDVGDLNGDGARRGSALGGGRDADGAADRRHPRRHPHVPLPVVNG